MNWVLVPVVVRKGPNYLTDLGQGDFRLYVDDVLVPIASFEAGEKAPISVHFLQDLSGSIANAGKLEISRKVVRFFLGRAQPGDEFAITTFGSGIVEVQLPFTTDLWQLRRNPEAWEPYGTTALHDAVAWLPDIATGSQNAKRVAILVTDGVDNASQVSPGEARELVRQAELPVYVLGLASGSPFSVTGAGKKLYRNADMLNLLALQTGGRYAFVDDPDRVWEVGGSILSDLRHQYVLGFPATAGPRRDHEIRVEVRGRGRRVLYRQSYRGGPPAPGAL